MEGSALLTTPPAARTKLQALASAPSSSPVKPRLLWRGALHLADGTALPGIAIVSTVQPAFPGLRQAETTTRGSEGQNGGTADRSAPLSLSAEAQDDLCLSIEMVRHAPLQIVNITRDLQQDDHGQLTIAAAAPIQDGSQASLPSAHANMVTFEAGGNVRLYIDPSQESTVAYFERMFCYGEGRETPRENSDADVASERRVCASSIMTISLDKSITKVYTLQTSLADIASDPMWRGGGTASDVRYNASDMSLSSTSGGGLNTAMEAVVMAIRRHDASDDTVELHVGRKIVRRLVAAAEGGASLSAAASNSSLRANASALPARPDDPAPRTLSRIFARSRSRGSIPALNGVPATILHAKKKSSDFAVPAPVPKRKPELEPSTDTTRTDKRLRGDERDRRRSPAAQSPDLQPQESQEKPGNARKISRTHSASSASASQSKDKSASAASQAHTTIEERNRSLVKKLVHHQLLGKGLERHDDAYLACFGPTCQGALLALRHVVKTQTIDRQQAVPIIERHLEMYL